MKKLFLILTVALGALTLQSCKDNTEPITHDTKEFSLDATSYTTWHYISLAKNEVVGTGEENDTDNAAWFARTDWDIAVCRYNVRTNSGAASSTNAMGGVSITTGAVLADVTSVPSTSTFKSDVAVTSTGMGGVVSTEIYSEATVIQFQKDADGNTVMPPVYEKSPVYVFRSADGSSYFKIEFTQYQNETGTSGHVKYLSEQF